MYLHTRTPVVVHADVKAVSDDASLYCTLLILLTFQQNVMISEAGEAMLCDFGISKLLQEGPSGFTTTATPKGTPRFMAKELLEGTSGTTIRSDVYAFGGLVLRECAPSRRLGPAEVLRLEIMTGKLPFVNLTVEFAVTLAISQGKMPAPEYYPELPATHRIWELLRRCWSSDATQRPTMSEVLTEVRASRLLNLIH